jgi:AraC-like DNA-binding protein
VSLRGAAPRRAVARFLAQCGPVQTLTSDSAMVSTLLGTVADLLGGDSASPHAISERAYAVAMRLLELADAAPEVAALPAPYADLPGWCRQRLPGLTVSDLAAHVGLSREHFSRHFRQVCGFGPGRWLSDLRQHAGLATLRGGGSLAQAAAEAGLANASVLRRALQRRLGWHPAAS